MGPSAKAGASTRLFTLGELDLPMCRPGMQAPRAAQALLEATATAQAGEGQNEEVSSSRPSRRC